MRVGLWGALERGDIDTIGSDHSPAPPGMKRSDDFFEIWGGISGCQHGFELLISEALKRRPAEVVLPQLSTLFSANVAHRFRIGRQKGAIAVGLDADMTILRLHSPHVLSNKDLLYRHTQGPYDGRASNVRIARTIVRGRTVFSEGRIAPGAPTGQFIRPS
jgi:allantoinase